jgi:hypothetical protein
MCLRFQFCTHQRVYILYFRKKSQIRCTLVYSDLTPGLRQCTHGPELPCVAGTLPPINDPMYSPIHGPPMPPSRNVYGK